MDTSDVNDYAELKTRLESLSDSLACEANYLFYYATPPLMYTTITHHLKVHNLTCQDSGWKRNDYRKTLRTRFSQCVGINQRVIASIAEDQIYRIDHYLGKGNRTKYFSNTFFEQYF